MTQQLRAVFTAYWACRSASFDVAANISRARLAAVAEALRNGWTNEQIAELDGEAKRGVMG